MITVTEAERLMRLHLGDSERVHHSEQVGRLMRGLSQLVGAEAELWQCVGLLHDIDYPATTSDRSRHGAVAAEQLRSQLPEEGRIAITAHDHRTGIRCETLLGVGLRAADALAVMMESASEEQIESLRHDGSITREDVVDLFGSREYLVDLVTAFCTLADCSLVDVLGVVAMKRQT